MTIEASKMVWAIHSWTLYMVPSLLDGTFPARSLGRWHRLFFNSFVGGALGLNGFSLQVCRDQDENSVPHADDD
jgi:hypothetical protein